MNGCARYNVDAFTTLASDLNPMELLIVGRYLVLRSCLYSSMCFAAMLVQCFMGVPMTQLGGSHCSVIIPDDLECTSI